MKEHRQKWESAVAEWKDLICKLTLNQFISFVESSEVLTPPDLEKQKEFLAAEQTAVNRRREELLRQIAGFRPPVTSKSAVYEWKESMDKLNQQLGTLHTHAHTHTHTRTRTCLLYTSPSPRDATLSRMPSSA